MTEKKAAPPTSRAKTTRTAPVKKSPPKTATSPTKPTTAAKAKTPTTKTFKAATKTPPSSPLEKTAVETAATPEAVQNEIQKLADDASAATDLSTVSYCGVLKYFHLVIFYSLW